MSFVPVMQGKFKIIPFGFAHKIYCLRSYYIYFPEGTFKTIWKVGKYFLTVISLHFLICRKLNRTLYQMRIVLLCIHIERRIKILRQLLQ